MAQSSSFLCPLKVALEVLHYMYHVLGSLGWRLLMTSTLEPNTIAPQSALCISSRKWKTKLIVPIYFGTKTSKFCFKIISFLSLESELSFDLEDSEINFDGARTTTVNSLLRVLRATYNISRDEGEQFFRNGKLDTKWRSKQTTSSKNNSRTDLNGNFVT